MEARSRGSVYLVAVSPKELSDFAKSWPGHHFDIDNEYVFEFDRKNGDLIDMNILRGDELHPLPEDQDGPEFVALAEEACRWGAEALLLDDVMAIRYPSGPRL